MPDNFDPNSIEDRTLRQVGGFLMKEVEELTARVKNQAAEIQRFRDKNNHLKGEQPKPIIDPNLKPQPI